MENKDNKKIWLKLSLIILVLLILVLVVVICMKAFKVDTPPQVLNSGENINQEQANLYQISIDSGDCLSDEEIAELMDLGEYANREKMVYKKNDTEHYAEIWKIKVSEDDSPEKIYSLLNNIYLNSVNTIESGDELIYTVANRENRSMFIGGNVATLIISDCLNDASELTNDWLK